MFSQDNSIASKLKTFFGGHLMFVVEEIWDISTPKYYFREQIRMESLKFKMKNEF